LNNCQTNIYNYRALIAIIDDINVQYHRQLVMININIYMYFLDVH